MLIELYASFRYQLEQVCEIQSEYKASLVKSISSAIISQNIETAEIFSFQEGQIHILMQSFFTVVALQAIHLTVQTDL